MVSGRVPEGMAGEAGEKKIDGKEVRIWRQGLQYRGMTTGEERNQLRQRYSGMKRAELEAICQEKGYPSPSWGSKQALVERMAGFGVEVRVWKAIMER